MTIFRCRIAHLTCALLVLTFAAAGCRRDPNRSVARADKYAGSGQYKEAIIEYRRALQVDPRRADVHYKLAKAYIENRDVANAYAEYSSAADLDPSNVDAQMQAGQILLLAGEFERAKARANAMLALDKKSVPGRILLGNALAGLNDTAQALKQMEEAVALDPTSAPAYAALGAVQFAAQSPAARKSFEQAVTLDPKSIEPRLALANYDWSVGDRAAAEQDLKTALQLDRNNSAVLRALALLYLTEKRAEQAEPYFQMLASQSADGAVALADYYSGLGRNEEALRVLEPLSHDAKAGRLARMRMVPTLRQLGRRDEALSMANALVKDRPQDADAHSLKARLLLAPPVDAQGAWAEAQQAVKADAESAPAYYTLGLAALARRDTSAAESAFTQTLKLNPRAAAAQLQLAKLQLARGDTSDALNSAEAVALARPNDAEATVVLARSLRARGDTDRARRELSARLEDAFENVPMTVELGWVELTANHPADARAAFERALARDPKNEEARSGVIAADLASRDVARARRRVTEWLTANPDDASAQVLAARIDLAQGADASAEQRLLGVIRSHPDRLDAYEMLAANYMKEGKMAAALEKYRAIVSRAPESAGPATMVGILLESSGDVAGARAQYESVLAKSPRAGVAANNLAWILGQDGQYDDALRWARVAVETLRMRPEPQDTIGWIELKSNRPVEALAAFERALSLAPQNSVYKDHAAAARKIVNGK